MSSTRFYNTLSLAGLLCLAIGSPAAADDLYFPTDTWETVEPKRVGWDEQKLSQAVDFAMSRKSSGVLILHRGRILAEKYQELPDAPANYRRMLKGKNKAGRAIEDVASVQKSVVSFLVGTAQEKQLLKISDPVSTHLKPGWSKATPEQESAITVEHLISMSSGLSSRLKYVAPPGRRWRYNTTAYSRSLTVVAAASGMSENELTSQWLTDRIGMKDSRWVRRLLASVSTVDANRFGFATTNRDLARFGLLIMADGKWQDETILKDQAYLAASLKSSQTMNPSYGYLWWLNGQKFAQRGSRRVDGSLIPTAPADLKAAFGALGRKCYVVPSLGLVVTRLGDTPDVPGKPNFDRQFWRLLMEAAPK